MIVGVGIVVALVVLAGALFALFSTLGNSLTGSEPDAGEGGSSPVATAAASCDDCLTFDQALELRRPDGIPALALVFDEESGYAKPSIAGAYADSSADLYVEGSGTPAGCSFALDYSPVAPENPDESNRSDRVADLGSYVNDTDYLSMVARVFERPEDAANYPDALRAGIAGCPHYFFVFPDGSGSWSSDVEPLEIATSSPEVTAVGWHEAANGVDLTIVDLQYANLAVRVILNRSEGSSSTDEQFREFLVEYSGALAGLAE